ncbi:hypothetical protein BDN71DRAFT_1043400 [Pleurotus eryngii]|uniref:RRM domain-containing protein n=1 Tax=Pleurotus eryngii TaxID=5323 RepID=A0A9P6DDG3_PLEER|nr:hypothetical protein BDN71DRAFT_1043400 [Pleurotus eryngii]
MIGAQIHSLEKGRMPTTPSTALFFQPSHTLSSSNPFFQRTMDKSLDEIISTRPRNARRGSRRGSSGRAQILGTSGVSPSTRARAAPVTKVAAVATQPQVSDRIMVSNLPQDVNEAQIKDLFHSTVGPLRDVQLYFDHSGRSKGMAQVHFQRKGDGNKAFAQYNNRLIDGKRPMKIEIVVDPSRPAAAPSLAARVAPAPVATNAPQADAPRFVAI